MKKQYKLGVIGCGFMARAILKGVVMSDFIRERKIIVSDLLQENLDQVKYLGVNTCQDNTFVAQNCEYLLIAVKPQNFLDVVQDVKNADVKNVISIMAGIKKDSIKERVGLFCKVARVMPNLPATIGSGAMAVDLSDFDGDVHGGEFVYKLLDCLGKVTIVKESQIDAVTGISGSAPAYVFMFIDALVDAGVKNGLTRAQALNLVTQTVIGSAEMVERNEKPVSELVMNVCSKGGTTIEAVKTLEEGNFRQVIDDAVNACIKRSKELSK